MRFPTTATGRLYARLSQTRGSDDVSIERQVTDGQEWFRAQGIERVEVYVEPKGHRSGGSIAGRPEYRRMMSEIQSGDVLWCNDQARFSRADDYMVVLDGLRKRNITVVFHNEVVSVADYSGRLVVRARGFGNTIYREMVSEAITKSYADFRRAGAFYQKKNPLGMIGVGHGMNRHIAVSDEGVYWINNQMVVGHRQHPPAAGDSVFRGYYDTVTEFFKVYVFQDMGSRVAARYLNERGYCARGNHGLPVSVDPFTLIRVLNYIHHYRGFIDDALLDAVGREIEANRQIGRRGRNSPAEPSLLRRLLFCEHCGARYTTSVTRRKYRNERIYTNYVHNRKWCKFARQWSAREVNGWFWEVLEPMLRLTPEAIAEIAASMSEGEDTAAEIERLEQKLSRLEEAWIDGTVRRETYTRKVADLTAKLSEKRQAAQRAPSLPVEKRIEILTYFVDAIRFDAEKNGERAARTLKILIDKVFLNADGGIRIVPRKEFEVFFVS